MPSGPAALALWSSSTSRAPRSRCTSTDRWDTGFYSLEGEYSFVIADETVAASFGSWVYVPRGTPHAWHCDSLEARLLNVTVPGGFEGFYRQAGESVPDRTRLPERSEPDVEALSSTAARYSVRIVGPPPGT